MEYEVCEEKIKLGNEDRRRIRRRKKKQIKKKKMKSDIPLIFSIDNELLSKIECMHVCIHTFKHTQSLIKIN